MDKDSKLFATKYYSKEEYKDLNKSDFVFTNDKKITDVKFNTRPTTFFKDSIKRFAKNKSSVVAAGILGVLILMSFIVPVIDRNDVNTPHPYETYLEPKLFNSGTGFWDGNKHFDNIPCSWDTNLPSEEDFNVDGISNLQIGEMYYSNSYSPLGRGGYIRFAVPTSNAKEEVYLESYPLEIKTTYANSVKFEIANMEVEDNYVLTKFALDFMYVDDQDQYQTINLKDYDFYYGQTTINLNEVISTNLAEKTVVKDFKLRFRIKKDTDKDACILIKSCEFITNADPVEDKTYYDNFTAPSFTDANKMVHEEYKIVLNAAQGGGSYLNKSYWSCIGNKYLYKAEMRSCSFDYDSYEARYGVKTWEVDSKKWQKYIQNGWMTYDRTNKTINILDPEKCPVVELLEVKTSSGVGTVTTKYVCKVVFWKYLEYEKMPVFLMGTDNKGRDMFKYVFEGLRSSLILGFVTFAVCFLFGLLWGSVSGYFGGNVDLAMERFTDILSGLPWIVVMTLCIVHLGRSLGVFALALCLTGWIGTASLTRTQFYRFKGREYVLASRTLGAGDFRLIFKHILPNAMGTIITSSVLMIPSVIFSEATISYLGLGLQGQSSLGVILSDNQSMLQNHPYLLIFPSVIIALIMISFNLFGNGLRDAVNPSLKGEGE